MKKGTKSLMEVNVGVDLSLCEKVEFAFVQGDVRREVEYPSDYCVSIGDQSVGIIWTADDKEPFSAKRIHMDTRITLLDSEYQPETAVTSFTLVDTLFEEENDD